MRIKFDSYSAYVKGDPTERSEEFDTNTPESKQAFQDAVDDALIAGYFITLQNLGD